jgi:hypothetical protein
MGTLGSPPARLMAVPDKWVRPTKRPADLTVGPTDLVGGPHDLPEDSPDDLIQDDFKNWRARQDIGGFRPSKSTDIASTVIN